MLLLLWCSSCTWREGRVVGNDIDNGRVHIVVDDKELLPVRVLRDCRVVICVSPWPLPLSNPVQVVVAALLWCSDCHCHCRSTWREGRHGDKDVDRGRVDIVVVDKVLLRSKQTNTR